MIPDMKQKNLEILKLRNEDKSVIYRVKPEWKENNFQITIFLENSSAWYADISKEELLTLAKERSQNVDDYYKAIKQSFMEPESNMFFEVKLDGHNPENSQFIIKRKVNGRTILYFVAKLNQVNFQDIIFNLVDDLYEKNRILREHLENSEKRQIELEKEKQSYHDKLTEFVNLKANWEQEMYSNFLIVLNEKKKRIKFLTDLLTCKNINPDEIQEITKSNNSKTAEISSVPHKSLETISNSSSTSEYETDDENKSVDIEMEPTPSTSKLSLEIDEDSSTVTTLPKFVKKVKEKYVPQKIKRDLNSTPKILTEETQPTQDVLTQEPYLSTQERIDRM